MTIKYDSLQYRASIARLISEKRADAKLLLAEEARLFVRDVAGLTPPHTQQEGGRSVETNLRRAFSPLELKNFMGDDRFSRRVAQLVRRNDAAGLNLLFASLRKGKLAGRVVVMPDQMPGIHQRFMDPRGRVRKTNYLSLPGAFKKYLNVVKARVGWAKAGWRATAQLVGLSLPGYVTRHSGARGTASPSPAPHLAITMTNFATKIPNYQAKVDYALRVRYQSLVREAQRIMAGGKSRRGSFAGTSTGAPGGS